MEDKYRSVFQALYDFAEFVNDPQLHKFITKENIKNVIEKVSKIEQLCKRLEDRGVDTEFNSKLKALWAAKGINKNIEVSYFKNSSNLILSKILIDPKIANDIVVNAIKAYVFHKSKPELDMFLFECCKSYNLFLLLSSLSNNLFKDVDFTAQNLCNVLIKKLKVNQKESCNEVSNIVFKLIQEDMNKVFEIIFVDKENRYLKILQQIIFKNLYTVLYAGKKDIWDSLLNLEQKYVQCLIGKSEILKLILYKIRYSIKHLKCVYEEYSYKWSSDKDDCLDFESIVNLLNRIMFFKKRDEIKNLLDTLKNNGHRVIIEDIMRELKHDANAAILLQYL